MHADINTKDLPVIFEVGLPKSSSRFSEELTVSKFAVLNSMDCSSEGRFIII